MAMEINSVYNSYADSYENVNKKEKQKTQSMKSTQETTTGQTKLSTKAQKLLERLRKIYSDMDFMVADFDNVEEAKEVLSRGTKEFSVLFSGKELERMASDERYLQEKLQCVKGAVRMSEQINDQFGFESAFGKNTSGGEVTKIGIFFNDDGTTTFFAALEKSGEKQKERIEKAAERKAEEKKAEKEYQGSRLNHTDTKRTTVQADSMEELLEKIAEVDWNTVKTEKVPENGGKFDFSI